MENQSANRELFKIINGIEGCEEVFKADIIKRLDGENQHLSFQFWVFLNSDDNMQAVNPCPHINNADSEW